jgi:transcriptional regulator with XRE-family HTH domain
MEGKQLQEIRHARGWTQEELAELLRLGKGGGRTVRRWETGERSVPGPVIAYLEALPPVRKMA